MNIRLKFCFFGILCISFLIGCGQKGDLYLPDSDVAKKEVVKVKAKTTKKNK